jgi:penicillin-binding protein 1B
MFSRRLNTLSYGFTIIMALLVVSPAASGFNPFSLSADLDKKLKEQQFLPSTEYLIASKWLKKEAFLVAKPLRTHLIELGFQEKDHDGLRPEEFQNVEARICQEKMSLTTQPTGCIRFRDFSWNGSTDTPDILVALNLASDSKGSDQIIFILNESTLEELKVWPLKPQLLAQTVGSQPIMQKKTPLSEMPAACLQAVLSIEDTSFLEHSGVSITGTIRAFLKNIITGRKAQGGSTITQQLVKNYFLTPERTYKRKIHEILISVLLETKYTKDQILETYLNIIYMAQNGTYQVLGFPSAAEYYFGKPIENLEVHECALLAAVLNGPGVYNPFKNVEKSLARRNLVLEKMYSQHFLTEKQLEIAKTMPLPTKIPAQATETSPYFLESARQQLEDFGYSLENKKILLTLDLEAQSQAQKALQNHLKNLEKQNKYVKKILENEKKGLEGLVVSADSDGRIILAVGGRDFKQSQFNRITKSRRQIGSLVKPFIYLTAIEKGAKPLDLISDEKFEVKLPTKQIWSPENYDKKFLGQVPLYFALKNSLNAATAKLGLELGLERIVDTLKAAGIKSEIPLLPSLTLGALQLPPLDVLQAYLTLSQLGKSPTPTFVESVWDADRNFVYKSPVTSGADYLSPISTSITIGMMKQVLISGSAAYAGSKGLKDYWAGKTGTTSDYRDTWFAGFSPHETTVVWVGYDDNKPTNLTGASGAVPIWTDYTLWAKQRFPLEEFKWPDEVKEKTIENKELVDLGFNLEKQTEIKLIFRKNLFGF